MNCNIFKKRLEDYIEDNIPEDLKIAFENHTEQCESCRLYYEEQLKIDRAFREAFTIDGIQFNSSRVNIINSIDKNRYSKKTSNKVLFNLKRYKNKYFSYAAAAAIIVLFIPTVLNSFGRGHYSLKDTIKESANKYSISQKNVSESKQDNIAADVKDSTAITKAQSNELNKADSMEENKQLLQFEKIIVNKDALPSYTISWESSINKKYSAAIDIGEARDVDFGIHSIFLKNSYTNELVKYQLINNNRQYTPMNIEWWDNEHLIIVAGFGYGTIEHGSEVYVLDVTTSKLSLLYERKDKKHQILDMKKVNKDIVFQLLIYNDDTYNDFHKGVGKMTLLELDKPVDMIIESEEKK